MAMENQIQVSVCCTTYNQVDYIRDALEGFIMQKTNFAFEVLVHDDASTDGTADIIREHEKKYPDLIKPIYQTENQYSKGVNVLKYNVDRAKGKYIALCEGDDYWIDPYKLQKQYDALEKYSEIDMCAHGVKWMDAQSGQIVGKAAPSEKKTILTTEQVIFNGGGYIGTCSLFYRQSILKNNYKFFDVLQIDYSLQILGSLGGGILYLPDYMSIYRYLAKNSWTVYAGQNPDKQFERYKKIKQMLQVLDEDTACRYSDVIARTLHKVEWVLLETSGNYKEMLSPKYADRRRRYTKLYTLKLWFHAYMPWVVEIKKRLKHEH